MLLFLLFEGVFFPVVDCFENLLGLLLDWLCTLILLRIEFFSKRREVLLALSINNLVHSGTLSSAKQILVLSYEPILLHND